MYNDNDYWTWLNNFNGWTGTTTNTYTDCSTTISIWYSCPTCCSGLQFWTKFCPYCGTQLWNDPPDPTKQEIIEKLDELIKEITDLKAKLINDE